MKNSLLKAMALTIIAAVLSSCNKEGGGGMGGLQIFWDNDEYEMEAGETLPVNFTVNGSQGYVLDITAEVSDKDITKKLKVNPDYTGTITLTAPDIVTEKKEFTVTLNVVDEANKRSKSSEVEVTLNPSAELAVAFTSPIKSMATMPGKSFTLPFQVSNLAPAKKSDIKVNLTSGWTASNITFDDNSGLGSVKVTAPAALTKILGVEIIFKDDHNRTASLNESIEIVEIIKTTNAANCHMAKPGSTVSINTVKGNSAEKLTFNTADLLWQDAQGLVKSVAGNGDEGVIVVTLNSGKSGNAVVTAKQNGVIVWSWHIWATDYDPMANPFAWTHPTSGITYTYMDRNLGAMSGEKFSKNALGLMYQWGRKDPFTGGDDVESNKQVSIYDIDNNQLHFEAMERPTYGSDYTKNNLELAIQNPMTFYHAPSSAWPVVDWLTDKAELQNKDLWGSVSNVKSIYDPCPEGWWVPAAGEGWEFRKEYKKEGKLTDSGKYDPTYAWYSEYEDAYCIGFRYKTKDGKEYWYPQCGNIHCNSGTLQAVGGSGLMHTRTESSNLSVLEQIAWGNPTTETGLNRPYGAAVRCIKETK